MASPERFSDLPSTRTVSSLSLLNACRIAAFLQFLSIKCQSGTYLPLAMDAMTLGSGW